jgi:hypothetical protein
LRGERAGDPEKKRTLGELLAEERQAEALAAFEHGA